MGAASVVAGGVALALLARVGGSEGVEREEEEKRSRRFGVEMEFFTAFDPEAVGGNAACVCRPAVLGPALLGVVNIRRGGLLGPGLNAVCGVDISGAVRGGGGISVEGKA